MPETSQVIYSDFDNQFITNPITKSLNKKTNRDAVKQAVKNLILTDFGERPFNADIKVVLEDIYSNLLLRIYKNQIKEAVFTTIRNYEPRANIIDCLVEDRIDLNAISITVAFEIVNDPQAIVLDVILERVR